MQHNYQNLNTDDFKPSQTRGPGKQVPGDAEILDAYSTAVVHVVSETTPALISATNHDQERSGGAGSGFIISADGYAVTNSHVVSGRGRLLAITDDGDRIEAKVIGDDPATD